MKTLHILLSIISLILPIVSIVVLIQYPTEYNSLIFLTIFLVTSLFQVWFIRKYKISLSKHLK
jgi:hypothetical protein